MQEEWRDIPGYEGWYQVSDQGRVKRARPYSGRGSRAVDGILKPQNINGYFSVTLCKGTCTAYKGWKVHRLVALAFIGPRPDGYEINHKDGDRANNVPQNLEYVTKSENLKHSFRELGRTQIGENNASHKWTEVDVITMRKMRAAGVSVKEIAATYGGSRSAIASITRGAQWRHVEPRSYLHVR